MLRSSKFGHLIGFVFVFLVSSAAIASGTFSTLYSFDLSGGAYPNSSLLRDNAGNLYGTTDSGLVFELDASGKEHTLYQFCFACAGGGNPVGGVISDVNGNLYGVTNVGGAGSGGIVFKLIPRPQGKLWKIQVLHTFCAKPNCADGGRPGAGLTYQGAAAGVPYDGISPLYGTASMGGKEYGGVAFQLTSSTGKQRPQYSVIHYFCDQENCLDGATPYSGLIVDEDGNLFGTTVGGGQVDDPYAGTAFELSPHEGKFKEKVLYAFCQQAGCTDGSSPGRLVRLNRNSFIGTTLQGPTGLGAIFQLTRHGRTWSETLLYTYCTQQGCPDGHDPTDVTVDSKGNVFATASQGGSNNWGTLIELQGGTATVLHNFCSVPPFCSDGAEPPAAPIFDPSGNLFGTTYDGGSWASPYGTVYELTAQ